MKNCRVSSIFILIGVMSVQQVMAYRKYYIEDECNSPTNFQKVFFRLQASGPDSVGELRPNRFGTYSRMGRNCLIKLLPPKGYGVIVTVLKVDFRNHEGCKDYIKIYDNHEDGEKLCGYRDVGIKSTMYFSDEELNIFYHTAEGGMGFSNGFKLIFTVTNTDSGACASPDQFKCENSRCIWAGVTCDGINNCGDDSDEESSTIRHCRHSTAVAIAAIVLGVTTFTTILVFTCICCCRAQSGRPRKPPLLDDFPLKPNASYTPLPGYNPLPRYTYGALNSHNIPYQLQPIHSAATYPSAPMECSNCPSNPGVPNIHQKIEIRYDRPPPYKA